MSAELPGQDGGTGPGYAATLKFPDPVITTDWQVTLDSANQMLAADRYRMYCTAMRDANAEMIRRLRDGRPRGQVSDWYAAMVEHLNMKYRMSQ